MLKKNKEHNCVQREIQQDGKQFGLFIKRWQQIHRMSVYANYVQKIRYPL